VLIGAHRLHIAECESGTDTAAAASDLGSSGLCSEAAFLDKPETAFPQIPKTAFIHISDLGNRLCSVPGNPLYSILGN